MSVSRPDESTAKLLASNHRVSFCKGGKFGRAIVNHSVDALLITFQGWTIQLHLAGSQRNIKAFEANATEFMPERFLSTDNKLHR